uniref:Uncharacterized protein n=1 Tax=Sphaerodactylus townsendi TaxID=933632 RepID=A0ACB8F1K6_9SAUR
MLRMKRMKRQSVGLFQTSNPSIVPSLCTEGWKRSSLLRFQHYQSASHQLNSELDFSTCDSPVQRQRNAPFAYPSPTLSATHYFPKFLFFKLNPGFFLFGTPRKQK